MQAVVLSSSTGLEVMINALSVFKFILEPSAWTLIII
jgi:hypothetical protein